MGHRRKAREYALQALYMHEMSGADVENVLSLPWEDKESSHEIKGFAKDLIKGTISKQKELDAIIVKHSAHWSIERLSIIDKCILRMSIYAMLEMHDIPTAVTIDEAIELGKIYSGENAGQFINGILDAAKKSISDKK